MMYRDLLCLSVVSLSLVCFQFEPATGKPGHGRKVLARREIAGPPVIIIPGVGASIIDVKVDRSADDGSGCPRTRSWFRAWLNVKEMFPHRLPCLINEFRLKFDRRTNQSTDVEGVQSRVVGFGSSRSVEYMDDSWLAYLFFNIGSNAEQLIKRLLSLGYERDVSIRGAPYDFRYAMASDPDYFRRLKSLVEDTYRINGNSKVALISHSLGGLYSVWFLNRQTQDWKDKYIHSCITVSAPWGGSTMSLKSLTTGYDLGSSFIDPRVVKKAQVTFESTYLMLPMEQLWGRTPLVYADEKNYTSSPSSMNEMLRDIGGNVALYEKVLEENKLSREGVMPANTGVPFFCLHGSGIPTEHQLHLSGRNLTSQRPRKTFVDGDGTVTLASLSACAEWRKNLNHVVVPNTGHVTLWQSQAGNDQILRALFRGR